MLACLMSMLRDKGRVGEWGRWARQHVRLACEAASCAGFNPLLRLLECCMIDCLVLDCLMIDCLMIDRLNVRLSVLDCLMY